MIVCLEGHLLGYFARHLGEMTRQRDSKLHNMFILADVSRCWDCHDPINSAYLFEVSRDSQKLGCSRQIDRGPILRQVMWHIVCFSFVIEIKANELERYEYGIWKQKELIPQSWSWLVS